MLFKDFIKFLNPKMIEAARICFRIYLPLEKGGKYWFYCEPGTSLEEFMNGTLLGEGGALHDLNLDPYELYRMECTIQVETYNDDDTPNEISFTFHLDD